MGVSPLLNETFVPLNLFIMKRSKSLKAADKKVDRKKYYSVKEAIALMTSLSTLKFDATAEVHFTLGIDPRHAEQQIRSNLNLPNGTGKKVKIVVFCEDDQVKAAKASGAIEAGNADLIDKIAKGWTDFDTAVSTPGLMKSLAKVARVLGPKGLMPNPKAGTVTNDVEKTVKELMGGRIELRNDKQGIVHSIFGKLSFGEAKLAENLEIMIKTIQDIKPLGQKGPYIKNISISSSMGTGIKVAVI